MANQMAAGECVLSEAHFRRGTWPGQHVRWKLGLRSLHDLARVVFGCLERHRHLLVGIYQGLLEPRMQSR